MVMANSQPENQERQQETASVPSHDTVSMQAHEKHSGHL